MNFKHLVVGLLFAVLAASVSATELGVNYYHETLMSPWSGGPYMPRTLSEVGQDFDNIKQISNAVKIYMNPFVDENLAWDQQVAAIAKGKGMRVVVNMMVDDRQITDANWQDYSDRVVSACQALSGKADEVIVGNEITLHSPLDRADIRDRVIALQDRCKQVFPGDVAYEEFWYASDVWKGYNGRIYFMMYENIDAFRNNIAQMDSNWGANAYIGEWGEDLLEDQTVYDEAWQKDQIQQRWNIIQGTRTPIAYIFTYREPSWTAFGMVRPDGTRRPLWDVFAGGSTPAAQQPAPQPAMQPATPAAPAPVQQPAQQPIQQPVEQPAVQQPMPEPITQQPPTPPQQAVPEPILQPQPVAQQAPQVEQSAQQPAPAGTPIAVGRMPLTCAAQEQCSIQQDTADGSCRTVTFGVGAQRMDVFGCDKGDGSVELYLRQPSSVPFVACFGNGCVGSANGYVRFRPFG